MNGIRRHAPILLLAAACLLMASGFLFGTTPDDEEYRSAVLSAQLHARALLRGEYLTWTSQLGFGTPQPLGPSLLFHPLLPLLAWMPADAWVQLLLAVHLAIGVSGAWMLGTAIGLARFGRVLLASTLVLATPTQNYVLTDFWLTPLVTWTLVPWLVWGFLRLSRAEFPAERRRMAVFTGGVGGLIMANGHGGYLLVYPLPLLAFMAWHWQSVLRRRRECALLLAVALAIAAPTVYHATTEFLTFPAGLPRDNTGQTLALADMLDALIRPFSGGVREPLEYTRELGARVLFFGGPFTILALIGGVRAIAGGARRDLATGAAVALALLVTPGLDRFPLFTATYLFRDPLILFAAPLAALELQRLATRTTWRGAAPLVATAQLALLVFGAWPFLTSTWATRSWPHGPARSITRGTPLTLGIRDAVAARPGRIYLTNLVEQVLSTNSSRQDGLVTNGLAYIGLSVVNGRFKGVSVDRVHPSDAVPYGVIRAQPQVERLRGLLDIAGITYVLALAGEPVADGWEPIVSVRGTHPFPLVLWRNPTTALGAMVVDRTTSDAAVSARPGCTTAGLFCLDDESLTSLARPGVTRVTNRDGRIAIELAPAVEARRVLVAEMFRQEWRAEPAGTVLRPAFGGLMFVDVPAGVAQVVLVYRPWLRLSLAAAAWTMMAAAFVVVCRPVRRA